MKTRTQCGLIVGAIGAILNTLSIVLCCLCSPVVALLAGGVAGFWAARREGAATRQEAARAGLVSGAIAGILVLVGHLIGDAFRLSFPNLTLLPDYSTAPESPSAGETQMSFMDYFLVTGICYGTVNMALATLAGMVGGYLTTVASGQPAPKASSAEQIDPALIRWWAAQSGDAAERRATLEALAQTGPSATEALVAALGDRDSEVRSVATEALVEIGAVDSLVTELQEGNSDQAAMIEVLIRIGPAAIEPLAATLRHKDSNVRLGAAKALEGLGWEPGESDRAAYLIARRKWDACAKLGASAVDPLIAILKADSKMRNRVAKILEQIGAPAVESLIAVFKEGAPTVRERVATALGKIGDGRAIAPLLAALATPGLGETKVIVYALTLFGTSALEPLAAALKTGVPEIRRGAATALGQIGDPGGTEPLIDALKDQDRDVRGKAAQALGQIGDRQAIAPLIAALTDEKDYVRRHAAAALGEIGAPDALDPLLAALQDEELLVRQAAATALGRIGDERAVDPLLAALEDTDGMVRKRAAVALVDIGAEHTMDTVRACLTKAGYFESRPPEGDGLCSDNECPCPPPGTPIPRGEGFLYVPPTVVEMRRDAPTLDDLMDKQLRQVEGDQLAGDFRYATVVPRQGIYHPILMCRQGARRRGLDLETAARDAAFWWKTWLVPLRPTPKK